MSKKLYTYSEDQMKEVLKQLGELPAKLVLSTIQIIQSPTRIEEVKEESKDANIRSDA